MADLRQVEVVFKVDTTSDEKPSEKVKKGEKNKVQKEKDTSLFDNILVKELWDMAKNSIKQISTYELNKWFNLTDDYIGQRIVNHSLNIIGRAVGTAALAFKAGAKFGTVGVGVALAGAVIGTIVETVQNYDRQNIMLKQMDAQLQYQRQRAGYSLTSGRIGENR